VGVETTALTATTVVAAIRIEPENLRMMISFALRYVTSTSQSGVRGAFCRPTRTIKLLRFNNRWLFRRTPDGLLCADAALVDRI
jgi:hypothetical protein